MKAPLPPDEAGRLAALHDLEILDSAPEPDLNDIVALAAGICGVPVSLVSLVDADRQWYKARTGTQAIDTSRELSFCAHAILGRDLLVVTDTRQDARFADNPVVRHDPGVRFYAGAPLVTTDGFALGTLCVVDARPRRLALDQLQSLRALARQVTAQLELRRYARDLTRPITRSPGPGSSAYPGPAGDEVAGPVDQAASRLVDGHRTGDVLHLRRVDLAALTQRAVEAVRPIAASKQICILNRADGPALPVTADPVRLEQALMQLLFAVVKYAPVGAQVQVLMEAGAGPTVHLDNVELPAGVCQDLFSEPVHGAPARPGNVTGPAQGLAVATLVLHAHNATVALSDRYGDGRSLDLVFPGQAAAAAGVPPLTR